MKPGGSIYRAAQAGALLALAALAGCATPEPPVQVRRAELAPPPPPPVAAPIPGASLAQYPANAPAITAGSAILIDARTGETLYSKNPDETRPVASTQKLLTALLISASGDWGRTVTVAPEDTRVEPSKLGVGAGQRYTRQQLFSAMMVKSCNDAALCLARDHSGSTAAFAAEMNWKARQLGATNSRFVNPHGLTAPGQYSTARDIAKIAFVAYRDPAIRALARRQSYNFTFNSGRVSTLDATNKLLKRSPIYNGLKTGYTIPSGRCLVTSASSGGRDVILVQLGGRTKTIFDDGDRLVRWGLARNNHGYTAAN